MENNNQTLIEIINNLNHECIQLIRNFTRLAKAELLLACKSTYKIIILFIVLIFSSLVAWLGICGIIGISLVYYDIHRLCFLSIITVLNLVIVIITYTFIVKLKNDLTFKATKRQVMNFANSEN